MDVSKLDWVTVKTTLPAVPYTTVEKRPAVKTGRLLLRPLTADDAEALYKLRIQPEVMKWTVAGKVDTELDQTRKSLALKLPPHDEKNYDFAICIAATGELIGIGGSHIRDGELGWPVLGYMLRKEAWGKGYGTEFLKGFLAIWWALPRVEVDLRVDRDTVFGDGEVKEERILAVTVEDNKASQGVLRKNGLELVKIWQEGDSQDKTKVVDLYGFVAKPDTAK